MRYFKTSLAIIALALLSTGCKTNSVTATADPNTPAANATSTADANVIKALTGDWAILDINGQQVMTPNSDNYPYLGFTPNQNTPSIIEYYAYNGCNFLSGWLKFNGGRVSQVGEPAMTMKMCEDAPFEMAITTALQEMSSFKIQRINNESFLYINKNDGTTIMTLRKHNLNFLEGAWAVTKLNGKNIPATVGMQFVIDLQSKSLHGNAGCNVVNGSIGIDMERENGILFKDMHTTRMTCPDIDLETELLQTLSEVRSATPGSNDKTASLRNAGNETIISLKRITKEELRSGE